MSQERALLASLFSQGEAVDEGEGVVNHQIDGEVLPHHLVHAAPPPASDIHTHTDQPHSSLTTTPKSTNKTELLHHSKGVNLGGGAEAPTMSKLR